MVGTVSDTSSGTSSEEETEEETEESEEEKVYEPPCREAQRYIVTCPLCAKRVTNKCLRYSHRCGRSFCAATRAVEQQKTAEAALRARMRHP